MLSRSLQEESTSDNAAASLLDTMRPPGSQRIHVHDYEAQNVRSVELLKGVSCQFREERALVMADSNDLVLLNHAPDPGFVDYLQAIEVGARRDAILDLHEHRSTGASSSSSALTELATDAVLADRAAKVALERLSPTAPIRLIAYFSAANLVAFRDALIRHAGERVVIECGSHAAVEMANDKGRVRGEALRLGIPCAPGDLVSFKPRASVHERVEAIAAAAQRWFSVSGRVIVRGTWSAAGADVFMLDAPLDHKALQVWISSRPYVESCLVDARLPLLSSPNAQVWVGEFGQPSRVAFTGQRLDAHSQHHGNYYPFESPVLPDMESAVITIAQALGDHGYRGMLGIDLLELTDGDYGLPGFAFAETNGRMNASSYATALFESINDRRRSLGKRPCRAWLSRANAAVKAGDFVTIGQRLGDLLYQHNRSAGVIPYNTGLLQFGSIDLLTIADDLHSAHKIEREALARMK